MYSQTVINARIKRLSRKAGFDLVEYPLAMAQANARHFQGLLDPELGKLSRKLNQREQQYVTNERLMCQASFLYWLPRYAYILNTEGRLQPFTPNIAQQALISIWADLELQHKAIAMQMLKARQLGISTIWELAVCHRTQFHANVNAVVGSSDPDKTRKMAGMMMTALQNQPWFLMPRTITERAGVLMEFAHNSGISMQHGAQFTGIARGTTPTTAHLSELADFINPEDLIDASLLRAMHDSPWMLLGLESTAAGIHNWWHNKWEFNKENWPKGRSRLCPLFLPWFIGKNLYPTETWIRSRPVPESWVPAGMTEKHADRAKAYVKSNPLLTRLLGPDWQMPREQMWYWEVSRDEYKAQGNLGKWYQEMPADDQEAFQSTNISAFDTDIIAEYRESVRVPIGVFGFVGPSVPVRVQPDQREIDHDKPTIPIRAKLASGGFLEVDLVPLKFEGYSSTDFNNKLFVWEFPEDGYDYGIGVDTSDGVGLDRTVIQVLRKGDESRNDGQCAEFASAYINAYDLPPITYAVAHLWSSKCLPDQQKARVVIECNRNGEATQHEMRKMGWTHFHQWERYDNRRLKLGRSNKIGWYTNSWSRSMMMDLLIKMLRDGWVDVNSPWFVQEMQDLERDEVRQSMRAMGGGHDDRIMALGFVLFSLHVRELRGTQRGVLNRKLQELDAYKPDAFPLYQNAQLQNTSQFRDEMVDVYRREME